MKFFIIIGKNALYTYERNGQRFEQQFIEGSESFAINASSVAEDVNSYMEILANEKNLGTIAKLEFEVVEGSESSINKEIVTALGEYVEKIHGLDEILKTVIKKLLRDKKLLIDTYGINYEGRSYKLVDNNILRGEFDLLGYTIYCNDVADSMDV